MPRIGNMVSAVLALTAFATGSLAASQTRAAAPVLLWADEFDGDALDLSKWSVMTGDGSQFGIPGWGNNELQYYTAANATVADGFLTITAREQFVSGYDYTSARIRTLGKGDWTYGRFEMRAMLPQGQGMWPAFWMLPSDSDYGTWAASGEIDIMESVGNQPDRILGTIHYGGQSPDNTFSGAHTTAPQGTVASGFHEYAVEWEEGEIRWYLDGQQYAVQNDWYSTGGAFPAPFDRDFHLLLNLAVGGNLPGSPDATTVFPQEYVVDYVRVFQLPAAPSQVPFLYDNMEHANPFGNGWFQFGGGVGDGGIGASADVPPGGGGYSLAFAWGSGGTPGFFGGFGRPGAMNIDHHTAFEFWINPDAGQTYRLEVNLQDDDNGDNSIAPPNDDEFQYDCIVSPTGPCAISGGGWQRVVIPLVDFYDDGSFLFGGNGILDADATGNGGLENVVFALISTDGSDVSFRTDNWRFTNGDQPDSDTDGIADSQDNCIDEANADQRDTDGDGIGNACDPDLNGDCLINFADLAAMKSVFLSAAEDADLTGDGIVNFGDLAIMKSRFLGSPGPSGCPNSCAATQ